MVNKKYKKLKVCFSQCVDEHIKEKKNTKGSSLKALWGMFLGTEGEECGFLAVVAGCCKEILHRLKCDVFIHLPLLVLHSGLVNIIHPLRNRRFRRS